MGKNPVTNRINIITRAHPWQSTNVLIRFKGKKDAIIAAVTKQDHARITFQAKQKRTVLQNKHCVTVDNNIPC